MLICWMSYEYVYNLYIERQSVAEVLAYLHVDLTNQLLSCWVDPRMCLEKTLTLQL